MTNLNVVNLNDRRKKKNTRVAEYSLYGSSGLFFFQSGLFLFWDSAEKYIYVFSQADMLISFVIGALCLKVGEKAKKIIYGFCGYSAYVLVVDSVFKEPTSLQWFLETVLFISFVYFSHINEEIDKTWIKQQRK